MKQDREGAQPPLLEDPPTPTKANTSPAAPVLSFFELSGLFAISFSYGFVFNSLQSIVVPQEIQRLVQSDQSLWLGVVMAAGAFCQLAAPVCGAWSDRIGRRIPFLVHGSILTVMGVGLFLATLHIHSLPLLVCAFMLSTVGLSVQYAIMTSLLSDCVAEEQVGTGSGVIAMLAMLGSGFGYSMFAFQVSFALSYVGYMFATLLCLGISVVYIPKDSSSIPPTVRHPKGCLYDLASSLKPPDPVKYPDFMWACLGRLLFNAGLSGQVYLMFYFRDVIKVGDAGQIMSYTAVMALLGGIMAAIPSGILADRWGKKPLVYLAIVLSVSCLAAFMLVQDLSWILLIGLFFGMGNVTYLSVDYAIGVQCLPQTEVEGTGLGSPSNSLAQRNSNPPTPREGRRSVASDAAKDLGLFATAATAGQLLGQLLYGSILKSYQVQLPSGASAYTHSGYIMMYSTAGLLFFMSGISTKFITAIK